MHQDRSRGDSSPASPSSNETTNADEDLRWQGRVLSLVIEEDPHQLSYHEIQRELAGEKPSFDQKDAVARAVEGLVRAGLLRRCEGLILLTKPARHFSSLELS